MFQAADALSSFAIRVLDSSKATIDSLSALLIDTVASGGSVGFMHPLSRSDADAFWHESLAAAARGERIVFGAYAGDILAATVTLVLKCPPNQPHRAEIAKMMTLPVFRGRGAASALLREAERLAHVNGRTLLVLDTARDDGAAPFYERLGYTRAGEIPDYALKPHGGLTGTLIYWKRLPNPA